MSDFNKSPINKNNAEKQTGSFKAVFFSREEFWLVPNDLVRFQLRQRWMAQAEESGLRPFLLTFNQLESLLFEEISLPEIDDLTRRFILHRLSASLAPVLQPEQNNDQNPPDKRLLTSLADNLGDSFDRLKLAGLKWDQVASLPPADLAKKVADLGREYDRTLAETGHTDHFGKRRLMLDMLAAGHHFAALDGVKIIKCHWSQRLSPFETDFLINLANLCQVDIHLNVPNWLFDQTIDHGSGFSLLRTIGRIERLGPPSLNMDFSDPDIQTAPPPLAHAATYLLAPPDRQKPSPPPLDERLMIVETPSAYHEVEEAARSLKKLIIGGQPPDQLALVVPNIDRYGPLIDDVGRRFGLAFHFRRGESLADRGPARAALDLLSLWSSNWERPRLMNLLRSPYFHFTDLPTPDLHRLALKSGVTDERAQGGFAENLAKTATAIEAAMEARRQKDSAPPSETKTGDRPHKIGAKRLAQTLAGLVHDLEAAGQKLRAAEKWPIFIKEFKKTLNHFRWPGNLSTAPETDEINTKGADLAAAYAFKEELGKLARALSSPQAPDVSIASFSHWLTDVLEKKYLGYDRNREGRIQVLNYYDLHGGQFDEIFFLGLNERVFPQTVPEINWWPEQFTKAAADLLGRPLWNEASDRYQQEELMLALGLGQARKRVRLYYHTGDDAGHEVLPSPLVSAIMGLWPDDSDSPIPKEIIPWITPPSTGRAAGPDELWAGLINLKTSAWPPSLQTPENLAIQQNLQQRRARWRQMKNKFSPGAAAMNRWQKLRPTFSPSASPLMNTSFLATFGECPLKFWWGEALGLKQDDEPLENWASTSEGTLAHQVLEKFFFSRMPAEWPEKSKPDEARTCLKQIISEETDIMSGRDPLGRKPLWEIRADGLRQTLEGWLEKELESTDLNCQPMALEWAFNENESLSQSPPWELQLDTSESVFFHGRVDRIDKSGNRLVIRDYKLNSGTGFNLDKKNKIIPPRLWPLLTYTLAASSHFQKPVDSFLEILNPDLKKGRLPVLSSDAPEMTTSLAAREKAASAGELNFPETLAQTWRAVLQGYFPPKEREGKECQWCPFTLLCPSFNKQSGGD